MTAPHGYLYDLLVRLGLSRFQASTTEFLLARPLKVVLILLAALLLARYGAGAARRAVRGVQTRGPLKARSARAELRATTVGDVLAGAVRLIVWSVALLLVLDELGLNLAPLLAGAGIAGVAIGFGAQSLVKDFLSGFFTLVEDQYGVGDSITIGDTVGTVEDVSLRVTRVRVLDGTVWFVPNGEIRKVGNSSMGWGRAVVDLLLDHGTDLGAASEVIRAELERFTAERAQGDELLEPPELWGVQAITPEGVTVRVVAKIGAGKQAELSRELRARLSSALRVAGVAGPGQTQLLGANQASPPGLDQAAPADPGGGEEKAE